MLQRQLRPNYKFNGGFKPNSKAEPKTADISLNDVQAVSAPIDVLAVQQAAVTYGQKVQKIASDYQRWKHSDKHTILSKSYEIVM